MEGSEVVDTQQITSLIRCAKEFDMSGVIPASVATSVNKICTVHCLLTNFQNPLNTS